MTRRLVALQIRIQPAIQSRLERAMNRDRGATAVEYGLLVALIAAVIVTVVAALGTQIKAAFNTVLTNIGGTAVA